ncbi:MAG: biopolymer transport protein ExbD [Myxococcota bacterium]|jgi:biopolymer transport protein ExbD
MGASLGGDGVMGEINLTPLIDVVLVVLIIMMVNMPVEVQRMGAKLPKPPDVVQPPPPIDPPDQLVVALYANDTLALSGRVMNESTLAYELGRRLRPMEQKKVFIDAHSDVLYARVVDMMDIIQTAGGGVIENEEGNETMPVRIGFAKMKAGGPRAPTSVDQGGMPRGIHPGAPVVLGSRSEQQADASFQPMKGMINGCYMTALGRQSDLTGNMALRITVAPDGSLMGVEIPTSDHGDPELNECVRQVGERFTFPPNGSDTTAIVQFPFLLSPG